jgi:hypothetical protein
MNIADPNAYHSKAVLSGAAMGEEYGSSNIGNIEALQKVNDFNWLKEVFEQKYHGKN